MTKFKIDKYSILILCPLDNRSSFNMLHFMHFYMLQYFTIRCQSIIYKL